MDIEIEKERETTERRETGGAPGVVMLESGWKLDISWGSEYWGSWGLSPSSMTLMLVDTLYHSAPLTKEALGPKHYFHSTKDRIKTIAEKGDKKESCHARVSSPPMSI